MNIAPTLFESERKTNETLVCLPGMGIPAETFESVVPILTKSLNVIVFDLPGHKNFPKTELNYSTESLATEYVEKLESLGIKEFHILGHSFGGAIAQSTAIKYPEKVKKLIILSSSYGSLQRIDRQEFVRKELGFKQSYDFLLAKHFIENNPQQVEDLKALLVKDRMPKKYLIAQAFCAFSFSTIQTASNIKCPTLVVHGNEDNTIEIEIAKRLSEFIPDCHFLELNGVGHTPYVESPEAFADILNFVNAEKMTGEKSTFTPPTEKEIAMDNKFKEYKHTLDFANRIRNLYDKNKKIPEIDDLITKKTCK